MRCLDIALVLDRKHLGTRNSRVVDPRRERQNENHGQRAPAQRTQDKDRQQQKWERELYIDEPTRDALDDTAKVTAHNSNESTEERAEHHGHEADGQG